MVPTCGAEAWSTDVVEVYACTPTYGPPTATLPSEGVAPGDGAPGGGAPGDGVSCCCCLEGRNSALV